jgi:Protein of unknown function (DUF1688)
MGLFKRKTSKLSAYDEKKKPQSSEAYLVANVSPVSIIQNKVNAGFTRIPPNMSLPKIPVPGPPDPALDPAGYLRSIHAVRERSKLVMHKATSNSLNHFDVNMDMFQNTVDYVVSIIKVRRRSRSTPCSTCSPLF